MEIVKKECVGHVQTRRGTALRKLKTESGTKKLEDNKTLGGKGSLTNLRIDQLQIYYGLAIRRNVGSVDGMKMAISAILKHMTASNCGRASEAARFFSIFVPCSCDFIVGGSIFIAASSLTIILHLD